MRTSAARIGAIAVSVAVLAATLGAGPVAAGAATALDETFAAGQVVVDLRGTDNGRKLVRRPDSTIVVGGTAGNPGPNQGDPAFFELSGTGVLDGTFGPTGAGGKAIIDVGQPTSLGDFALDSAGRIVGVSSGASQFSSSFLFRLDTDGALDASFGTGGVEEIDFDQNEEGWFRLAVMADDSILVAGHVVPVFGDQRRTAVARFTEGGDPDPSFGVGGITSATLGAQFTLAEEIAISPGGDRAAVVSSFVTGGNGIRRVGLIQILTSDGSFDTTFSGDGRVTTQFGTIPLEGFSLLYQANGRIVVNAVTRPPSPSVHDQVVLRYRTDGTLDTTFSTDGFAPFPLGQSIQPRSVFLRGTAIVAMVDVGGIGGVRVSSSGDLDATFDDDGRLAMGAPAGYLMADAIPGGGGSVLTVGKSTPITGSDVVVTRLLASGAPDRSFRNGGVARYEDFVSVDQHEVANGAAVDGQGRIVLAGFAESGGQPVMAALRLLPNGYRDPKFGEFGGLVTATFADSEARDVGVLAGNQAVLVGCVRCSSTNPDLAVLRLTGSGLPDPAFSNDGHAIVPAGPVGVDEFGTAVGLQGDGRVVVAGTVDNDVLVARLRTNGTPDPTFPLVRTDIGTNSLDRVFDLAIQPNGRILVAGSRLTGGLTTIAVLRYTSAGVLDSTFSGDGKAIIQFGTPSNILDVEATSIAVRPDGRILVGANVIASGLAGIVRLTSTGGLDGTFSGDGRATFSLDAGDDVVVGIGAATNDRIVFGGWGGTGEYYAARVLPGGTLDTTFSGDGREYVAFDGFADARGMAVERTTGRVVVVGEAEGPDGGFDFAAARFDQ